MLASESIVVFGLGAGEAKERADVGGPLGELLEKGAPALLPLSRLAALAVSVLTPEQ